MHGVHTDLAFSLSDGDVMAWCIIMGEHLGGEFQWSSLSWKQRK